MYVFIGENIRGGCYLLKEFAVRGPRGLRYAASGLHLEAAREVYAQRVLLFILTWFNKLVP